MTVSPWREALGYEKRDVDAPESGRVHTPKLAAVERSIAWRRYLGPRPARLHVGLPADRQQDQISV